MAKLIEEDPSLAFVHDQEAAELKLFGQGEMHLRVALERLAARFGVTVETQKPVVGYRETIRHTASVRGRHKKQSGGHGQFGDVALDVAPGRAAKDSPSTRRCMAARCRGTSSAPSRKAAVTRSPRGRLASRWWMSPRP